VGLVQRAIRILRRRYRPHGFNVGLNLGHAAGAGVAGHFHVHVVCRFTGDANFMPLVGRTRVFIEDLDTTYDRLAPDFARARMRDARLGPGRGRRPTRKPR
jgi:ATP adenylyltransferase